MITLPTSFAQERLWFIDQLQPGQAAYNMTSPLRLRGHLDVDALREALRALVRRHEVLRTTFRAVDGRPMQVVHDDIAIDLVPEDLDALPPDRREAHVERVAREESNRPFDLTRGPLLRARLLRLAPDDHVALLVIHHIVSDGWSVGVMVRELGALYAACGRGEPSPLPELPVQYADYAQWQREWLQGEVLDRQLAYWRERLQDLLGALELPADFPRPAVATLRGSHVVGHLPPDTTASLHGVCRQEGVTPFMLLLAAFQALIGRYTGLTDLAVGTPVANRSRPETEGLIGFFVNTLVMRGDLSGDPTFRVLLQRVRQRALEAFDHQDLPFERLVEALAPERDRSRSPLVQVLFVLQNAPLSELDLPGLRVSPVPYETDTAKFDLTLSVWPAHDDGLVLAFEYSRDLFERATIERMAAHYRVLVEAALIRPDTRLSELPLMPASEQQRLLVEWNDTAAVLPRGPIHEAFLRQAVRTPEAPALVFEGQELTYAETAHLAAALARRLRALGVGPDVVVGLCADRSFEQIIGVLAIVQAGGAVLPLDAAYPPARLAFMLSDACAPMLLAHARFLDVLSDSPARVLLIDELIADCRAERNRGELSTEAIADLEVAIDDRHLAYVIYTSGSTGVPKGVAMPHGPLRNLFEWQIRTTRPGPVRTLQFSASSFDASFEEIFTTLATGGALVLLREEQRRDPEALLALLRRERIERWCCPFVALRKVAEAALGRGEPPLALREILTAGEALEILPSVAAFFEAHPDCALHNYYGPSETHVATAHALSGPPSLWSAFPPIGRPIANTRVYVVDRRGQIVPTGVPGELLIGGDCVARGYLGRPELTAERFVPDPWSGDPGARLYRTGDRVKYQADGALLFLGRLDTQVKVRGFRVEPGEVEAELHTHASVAQAVVLVREDASGERRLVAYVVPAPGLAADGATLAKHLRTRLPEYMVPRAFVTLEALPLTPSGKVDRRALPAPGREVWSGGGDAARGPVEAMVAELFAEVLRHERVGIHDNFFERGGHSLAAVQVIARVRTVFGVDLPVSALFDTPTVAGIAQRIEQTGEAATGETMRAPLRRSNDEGPQPLSFGQERLWFVERLDAGSGAYHLSYAVRLTGRVDVDALQAALTDVVARHEALRTRVVEEVDGPVARVLPPVEVALPVEDLRSLEEPARAAALQQALEREDARPYDLASGCLLRAKVWRTGDEEWVAFLGLHHLVADGWSLGVLVRELGLLYDAHVRGGPPALAPLPIQYGDYARWQKTWLTDHRLDAHLAYWRDALAGAPLILDLPADRSRPAQQTFEGGYERLRLDAALSQRIRALARQEGVTTFMTLLAAFQALLAKHAGVEDVLVGTPVANRTQAETEGLIGFFVNTLVLRGDLRGNPSFTALLARVKARVLDAFAHQELPFERLVDALEPPRDLSRTPVCQVLFAWENAPLPMVALPDVRAHALPIAARTAKFDLLLTLGDVGDRIEGGLEYAATLYDAETVRRWGRRLTALLDAVTRDPAQRVSELPVLDEEERRTLLTWSAAASVLDEGGVRLRLPDDSGERRASAPPTMFELGAETGIVATGAPVDGGRAMAPGQPIATMRAYVLDRYGALVPAGSPGELAIGGTHLARGDLGQPELTAERFMPDPWSGETGARLYRTGDRVKYRADGTLLFLGRLDASASPALAAQAWSAAGDAPRGPIESTVAELFAEVLRHERVGIHDNFFERGGHSLAAVQVIARVRRVFGIDLPVRTLFETPTVAGLAARVEQARHAPGDDHASPALTHSVEGGPQPLSFGQERLWFVERLDPGSGAYHVSHAARLIGSLDVPALQAALTQVVARHEGLRTRVIEDADGPVAYVDPPSEVALPTEDLRDLDESRCATALREALDAEGARPYDLASGRLLRARLWQVDEAEWVVFLGLHHVAADGWSMDVLIRELGLFYDARVQGITPSLAPLPLQYRDYARWQKAWLTGAVLEAHLAYWREALAGAPLVLDLPTDRPRPAQQTFQGAFERLRLDAALSQRVHALARQEGVTTFMTLLAAFQVLLARCADVDDVLVGTPVANRTHAETEGLIGFFVNTLVLRGDLRGAPTFAALLARVKARVLDAFAHQALPFERLVDALEVPRDLSRTPVCQVQFVWQSTPEQPVRLSGLQARGFHVEGRTSKCDLLLTLQEIGDRIEGGLEYATTIFDAETVRRWGQRFITLLDAVTRDPARQVSALPVWTDGERRQVLDAWSAGPDVPVPAGGVEAWIAAQAQRAPSAIAVARGPERLTYAELEARANRLAHRLRAAGVMPDVRVGLCLSRSIDLVTTVLAILKAGGAYVPVERDHPAARRALVLDDSGARVVVTDGSVDVPASASRSILDLRVEADRLATLPSTSPPALAQPDHLAYVLYTSGSTGRPKGVMIARHALANYVAWAADTYQASAGSGAPLHSPLAFDLTVTSLFAPLVAGRTVEIAPAGAEHDAVRMLLSAGSDYSLVKLTPAHLRLLGAQLDRDRLPAAPRVLVVGGEALLARDVALWRTHATHAIVVNEYGPTETTVGCAVAEIDPRDSDPLPIGRPIANAALYVCDRHGALVPAGVPGELFIGGAGLARGYLDRPDLTAERFVPDPFGATPGGRLYRSGDRARWRADGQLEYLGRLDGQLKVRGYRVEPGEIEAALAADPDVALAAVTAVRDPTGETRLAAYVVPRDGRALDPRALLSRLRATLPDPMVPASIVTLAELPITPNGKLDRRRLPQPDLAPVATDDVGPLGPRDDLELELVSIWREVLGTGALDLRDNFFERGGHSLAAVRLVVEVKRRLGRGLPVAAVFAHPTVEDMAQRLRASSPSGQRRRLVPLRAGGTGPPLFLVHPALGSVVCYAELADALAPDTPLYAFQAAGLEEGRERLHSVEDLAAAYVADLTAHDPTGPYCLGGWSFGGLVAYEMAHRLAGEGKTILLLALLDVAAPPPVAAADAVPPAHLLAGFAASLGLDDPFAAIAAHRDGHAADDAGDEDGRRVASVIERARQAGRLPGDVGEDWGRAWFETYRAHMHAAGRYVPATSYSGPALVVRASQGRDGLPEDFGWGQYVRGGVQVQTIAGHHYSIVRRPQVHELARVLQQAAARDLFPDGPSRTHAAGRT